MHSHVFVALSHGIVVEKIYSQWQLKRFRYNMGGVGKLEGGDFQGVWVSRWVIGVCVYIKVGD